ncbi:carboxypeptidase regulatory-like domain-containing protein [Longimicrobium sp.]|jgi:hypothetical protein|uniref:carboxypeptidase regulatory-like domain-containing protein n=1 Tax=Longimicrobium sp. TaxID=2029185 RepID=UPI002F92BCEB
MTRSHFAAALTALFMAAVPAAAQSADDPPLPLLTGRVVDRASGAAVPDAIIYVGSVDQAIAAGEDGLFRIRLKPGYYQVQVSRLGYADLTTSVSISADDRSLTIEMEAEPVLLERVQVFGNRLKSRRNSRPVSSVVFDRREMVASAAPDVLEFVRTRVGLTRATCRGSSMTPCAYVRGEALPVAVTVDEMPAIGGLDALAMYRGDELHMVEVYGGGRLVKVYTVAYVEHAARRGWYPM